MYDENNLLFFFSDFPSFGLSDATKNKIFDFAIRDLVLVLSNNSYHCKPKKIL